MFQKEKTNTTKGERDIMLGIFKNRGQSTNTQKLEYLVKHNYIVNHNDAWKVNENIDKEENEAVRKEMKRIDRLKEKMQEKSQDSSCGHFRVNGKSQIISDKKAYKPRSFSRLLPPPTPRSRSRQGQRPFSAVPNLAVVSSGSKVGQADLCRECQVRIQMKNAQSYNSADLIAPPSSPEPQPWDGDPLMDYKRTNTGEFQMTLENGKYQKCPLVKGSKKAPTGKVSNMTTDSFIRNLSGNKFLNVYIPTDEISSL